MVVEYFAEEMNVWRLMVVVSVNVLENGGNLRKVDLHTLPTEETVHTPALFPPPPVLTVRVVGGDGLVHPPVPILAHLFAQADQAEAQHTRFDDAAMQLQSDAHLVGENVAELQSQCRVQLAHRAVVPAGEGTVCRHRAPVLPAQQVQRVLNVVDDPRSARVPAHPFGARVAQRLRTQHEWDVVREEPIGNPQCSGSCTYSISFGGSLPKLMAPQRKHDGEIRERDYAGERMQRRHEGVDILVGGDGLAHGFIQLPLLLKRRAARRSAVATLVCGRRSVHRCAARGWGGRTDGWNGRQS